MNERCLTMKTGHADAARIELDPSAWVDCHGDYLYRYALSRLRDGEAAEEVVQQSFVAALQHTHQFTGRGTECAWLQGILKHKIVDFIRQRQRITSLSDVENGDSSESFFDRLVNWKPELRSALRQPLDSLEREEFWRILRVCLDALPVRMANVFVLREIEGHSTKEICKELEITPTNAWVLLHRARLRLVIDMNRHWRQEGPD